MVSTMSTLIVLSFYLVQIVSLVAGLRYDPDQVGFNLNENQTASDPLDYWGEWDHDFMPSPSNWRMPFYTIMLDRFVNGDPSNDDANGTQFEHDLLQTQLRHGGDIAGLKDSLDYLQGMGIKVGQDDEPSNVGWLNEDRRYILREVRISTYHGLPTVTALWI